MGEAEARALAERLLAGPLPDRWQHVQAVAADAARRCEELGHERETVVCAAWLHDIGYSPTVAESQFHPLDGARYLRAHDWPESVCALVAHHTDAVRLAAEHGLSEQLAAEFADVADLDRDVLWAADALTGPVGQRMTLAERIREISARYGPRHAATTSMIASRDVLQAAIDRVERKRAARTAH